MPEKYWNYRVMRTQVFIGDTEYFMYGIHEVHYRCGKPDNWSKNVMAVSSDDVTDIKPTLEKMLRGATEFPVLDFATGEEIDA